MHGVPSVFQKDLIMLKRVKCKETGPYTAEEFRDIMLVTNLIITKAYSRDPELSKLERDYVWFCRKTAWAHTSLPLLTGLLTFVFIDRVPLVKT